MAKNFVSIIKEIERREKQREIAREREKERRVTDVVSFFIRSGTGLVLNFYLIKLLQINKYKKINFTLKISRRRNRKNNKN